MSRRAVILFLVILAVAVRAADTPPVDDLALLPSLTGLTGLVRVPTADVMPETMMRVGYNWSRGDISQDFGGVSTYLIGVGVLPRVEGALSMGQFSQAHDFTVHGKVQLLREQGPWPAVAVGFADFKRTQRPGTTTKFLVATRHYTERTALTLGAAIGNNRGLLAGGSFRLGRSIVLEAEYDGRNVNEGVAVLLPRDSMLRLQHIEEGVTASVSTQFNLNAPSPLSCPAPSAVPATADVTQVQQALIALGLERVRVTREDGGARLAALYENRRYTLNDLDSVCAVLATLADVAPAETTTLTATVTHRGIPVLAATTGLAAFRAYRAGTLNGPAFARQLQTVTLPTISAAPPVADSGVGNPVYGHSDLIVGPGVISQVGTDYVTLALGVFARGEVVVPVAKGMVVAARAQYPLGGPLVRDVPKRLDHDRLVGALAFRATPRILGQLFAGRFPDDYTGVGAEAAMPLGSRGLLHATVSRLRHIDWERTTGIADYIHLLPRQHVQVRAYAGRFLDGDTGGGIDVVRFFHEVQISIGVRDTTSGRLAHVRVSVPLSPRIQPHAPSSVRLRTADFFDYRVRSIVQGANYLTLAMATGNELLTGVDLTETMLNRNRDLPDAVRAFWE